MIYLPWIAFLLAVLWMIRQGDKAKEEYLRRKAEQERAEAEARLEELKIARAQQRQEEAERERKAKVIRVGGQLMGESPLAETFGRRSQERNPQWKQ